VHKDHYKSVRYELECKEMLGTLLMPYIVSVKSRLTMSGK
jgi:hypothetical protein